ncbi:uncharacterized protein TNIN_46761 [Trichonephila inaurata madagascariensis]|uniref:Gustatory receptor n=1 Tax=Trichonephila inaurata madagascariensis TaxID=2747483 RepID=A0A8X6YM91_9ARAC|nr:uncharacterized protein TNIN_46761 [Trichonephila inaurata madagascariensis]
MRWVLCFRFNNIVKIPTVLMTVSNNSPMFTVDGKTKYLYAFGFLTTVLYIPVTVCSVLSLLLVRMKVLLFMTTLTNSVCLWIVIMIAITVQTLVLLPSNIFAIYYTTLCYHLRLTLESLGKSLHNAPSSEYDSIYKKYISIRKCVTNIDDELSFLVFLSSIYNACNMYFGITVVLHTEEYLNAVQISCIYCLFTASYVGYIGMTLTGSLLQETAENLWFQVHDSLISRSKITSLQQRFLSILEKGLFLLYGKLYQLKEVLSWQQLERFFRTVYYWIV